MFERARDVDFLIGDNDDNDDDDDDEDNDDKDKDGMLSLSLMALYVDDGALLHRPPRDDVSSFTQTWLASSQSTTSPNIPASATSSRFLLILEFVAVGVVSNVLHSSDTPSCVSASLLLLLMLILTSCVFMFTSFFLIEAAAATVGTTRVVAPAIIAMAAVEDGVLAMVANSVDLLCIGNAIIM